MKKVFKRYRSSIILLILMLIFTCFNNTLGILALKNSASSILQMLTLLPPIFILIGLLDVWISKETFSKYMGNGSGIKGIIASFIIGSCSQGPLYAAFPIAVIFMKKGVSFFNILIFLGAWSATKIPMILFEGSNLGWKLTITMLIVDIIGIIIMSYIILKTLSKKEIQNIYHNIE